jgi:predicted dehydrogenase
MQNNPIKTAVIGYGFSARTFHIPFLQGLAEFEFCAIASSQHELVQQQLPGVVCYPDAHSLLAQSDAELVIITSPNHSHAVLVEQALLHNKHVIVEKPFVTNSAQGEKLIALATAKNLMLSVYHNRRWDGDFLTVKKLLADNTLGELRVFESHFDRFRLQVRQRWRETAPDGGGLLFDLGPHLIDQALQLFGKPVAISATCRQMRDDAVTTDYFQLQLHYPKLQVMLHSDMLSAAPNRRFSLKGTLGSYEKYGLDPQEQRLIAGMSPLAQGFGLEESSHFGLWYRPEQQATVAATAGCKAELVPTEAGAYQHYFVAIAAAIRQQQAVPVSAEDALLGIRLIELAIQSSEQGKTLLLD